MTTDTLELPELPEHAAAWVIPGDDGGSLKEWVDAKADSDGEFTAPLFTAKDMRAYATAAVLAERGEAAKLRRALDEATIILSSLSGHTLSRNNLESLAAEWVDEFASAIRNKE